MGCQTSKSSSVGDGQAAAEPKRQSLTESLGLKKALESGEQSVLHIAEAGSGMFAGYYKDFQMVNDRPDYFKIDKNGKMIEKGSPGFANIFYRGGEDGQGWRMDDGSAIHYECPTNAKFPPEKGWVGHNGNGRDPLPSVHFPKSYTHTFQISELSHWGMDKVEPELFKVSQSPGELDWAFVEDEKGIKVQAQNVGVDPIWNTDISALAFPCTVTIRCKAMCATTLRRIERLEKDGSQNDDSGRRASVNEHSSFYRRTDTVNRRNSLEMGKSSADAIYEPVAQDAPSFPIRPVDNLPSDNSFYLIMTHDGQIISESGAQKWTQDETRHITKLNIANRSAKNIGFKWYAKDDSIVPAPSQGICKSGQIFPVDVFVRHDFQGGPMKLVTIVLETDELPTREQWRAFARNEVVDITFEVDCPESNIEDVNISFDQSGEMLLRGYLRWAEMQALNGEEKELRLKGVIAVSNARDSAVGFKWYARDETILVKPSFGMARAGQKENVDIGVKAENLVAFPMRLRTHVLKDDQMPTRDQWKAIPEDSFRDMMFTVEPPRKGLSRVVVMTEAKKQADKPAQDQNGLPAARAGQEGAAKENAVEVDATRRRPSIVEVYAEEGFHASGEAKSGKKEYEEDTILALDYHPTGAAIEFELGL